MTRSQQIQQLLAQVQALNPRGPIAEQLYHNRLLAQETWKFLVRDVFPQGTPALIVAELAALCQDWQEFEAESQQQGIDNFGEDQ